MYVSVASKASPPMESPFSDSVPHTLGIGLGARGAKFCIRDVATSLAAGAVAVATGSSVWVTAVAETVGKSGWIRARSRSLEPDTGVELLSLIAVQNYPNSTRQANCHSIQYNL